jgi:hypothetical protein
MIDCFSGTIMEERQKLKEKNRSRGSYVEYCFIIIIIIIITYKVNRITYNLTDKHHILSEVIGNR